MAAPEMLRQYALPHPQESPDIGSAGTPQEREQPAPFVPPPGLHETYALIATVIAEAPGPISKAGIATEMSKRGHPVNPWQITNGLHTINKKGDEHGIKIENQNAGTRGYAEYVLRRTTLVHQEPSEDKTDEDKTNPSDTSDEVQRRGFTTQIIAKKPYEDDERTKAKARGEYKSPEPAIRIGPSKKLPDGGEIFDASVDGVIYTAHRYGKRNLTHFIPKDPPKKEPTE